VEEDAPSSAELEKYPLAKTYLWTSKKTLESTPLKPSGLEKRWLREKSHLTKFF